MSKAFFISLVFCGLLWAQDKPDQVSTENRNVTIISAQSTADGKHQIAREKLEECIISLPDIGKLEPMVSSKIEFLHHIDGKKDNNDHVRVYEAEITINYLVYQKEMIIIASNTVPATEPVIKEVEKTVQKSFVVTSDPGEGDLTAERSPRRTFFSSSESAAQSAKEGARIWISQHQNLLCPK